MSCINTESQRRARAHVSWHLKRRHRFARTEHLARTSLYSPAYAYASAPCSAIILAWSAPLLARNSPVSVLCVCSACVFWYAHYNSTARCGGSGKSRSRHTPSNRSPANRMVGIRVLGDGGFASTGTNVCAVLLGVRRRRRVLLENLRNDHICVTVAPTVANLIMLFMI